MIPDTIIQYNTINTIYHKYDTGILIYRRNKIKYTFSQKLRDLTALAVSGVQRIVCRQHLTERSFNEVSVQKTCKNISFLTYGYFVSIDTPCNITAVTRTPQMLSTS